MLERRVCARAAVPRGAESQPFSARELAAAGAPSACAPVCVELSPAGRLRGAGGACVAAAAAVARLAPHVAARTAVLALDAGGTALLRLRVVAALAPRQELLLWLDEALLAAVDMPFLTLRNIAPAGDGYACHACGARFEHPNPLKVHLFLSCREYDPRTFWVRLRDRLEAAAAVPAPAPAPPSPAALEALAAAWGRARGGHVCLYCGKLYSRKYGLKIHIRTHTGYKPLRCAYCARAFGDPSNLNKHVRLHAGARAPGTARHACALCGAALARRRDLERHVRARHAAARETGLT